MISPIKQNTQDVYRKKEIADKFSISIGTVNNRIKDGTFTKIILHGNSRLVYFDCDEVDRYFRGEAPKINKLDASIITPHMKQKVKLVPTKKREAIEVLLKRIEDIENDLGFEESEKITNKISDTKKKKRAIKPTIKKENLVEDDGYSWEDIVQGKDVQKKKAPRKKQIASSNTNDRFANRKSTIKISKSEFIKKKCSGKVSSGAIGNKGRNKNMENPRKGRR